MAVPTRLLHRRSRIGYAFVLIALASGVGFAGPGPESAEAAGGDRAEQLRQRIEVGMGELAAQEETAQKSKDFARTACVVDKREKGGEVMELATDELLIIRDPSSGEQARTFAVEKLEAAAERMDLLVEDARACGLESRREEDRDKAARTDQDKDQTVPMEDPSQGMGADPVPPTIDGSWPAVASGSE